MRRLLLVLFVAISVPSCGVTQWQRDRDAVMDAIHDLNSPEMDARIAQARK